MGENGLRKLGNKIREKGINTKSGGKGGRAA
jgi:hypothetical protein